MNLEHAIDLYDAGKHIKFQKTMVLVDRAYKNVAKAVKVEIDEYNTDITRLHRLGWSKKLLV
jgi:hypothetical protein